MSQLGGGDVSCKPAIATFTTFFCPLFIMLVGTNDSCLGTVKAPTSTSCYLLDLHMSVINCQFTAVTSETMKYSFCLH